MYHERIGNFRRLVRAESLVLLAVALGLSMLSAGCRSSKNSAGDETGGNATAAVQIRGNTPGQITQAATQVFVAHGYIRNSKRPGRLVFEKPAGKMSNLAYGSWVGDTPVWTRVKLFIVPSGEMQYTLRCEAYRVQDKGSSTEEETKLGKWNSGSFKKLLEEVAASFMGSSASPDSTAPSELPRPSANP